MESRGRRCNTLSIKMCANEDVKRAGTMRCGSARSMTSPAPRLTVDVIFSEKNQ